MNLQPLKKEFDLPADRRVNIARKLVCFFFVAGIAFSYKLWITERFFPVLPVADFVSVSNHTVHYFLAILLVLLLLGNIITDNRLITSLILLLLVYLLIQDQNRWQPWVYLFCLVLLPFALRAKVQAQNLGDIFYLQLIVVGVYGWSGIHKLNPNFIDTVFFEILTKFFWFKEADFIAAIKPIGYIVPIIEIAIAIHLFLPRFRNQAVLAAVAMHIFILLYLSPLGIGANTVVYPWNLAMQGLVVLLFYNFKGKVKLRADNAVPAFNTLAILLLWVMPFFNYFGIWDNYLSFSLYSGKTNAFYVVIGDSELPKIDGRLAQYFLQVEGLQGGEIIHVNEWALGELNVPFYPETRVLKKLSRHFCEMGIQQGQLYFLEFELPVEKQKFIRFTCAELRP